ncbi:MAG TPA: hypothetical protein EYQ42_01680 [Thiotrichaceae bacterium]|nr:hypothetical protein [Thiotrichaceae bacterium]HIM07472.1 hypothetical protein [Gammaproteobacteria bacterium]
MVCDNEVFILEVNKTLIKMLGVEKKLFNKHNNFLFKYSKFSGHLPCAYQKSTWE